MAKVVGAFIKELPLPIQKKACKVLVFCKNNVVRFNRKKARKKRV